ncbi:MAG: hypothetical protein EPO26_10410 [Chloroflexota bacterium]|nr:MAG: hypothetical protein EPO26_10410 [Chloroflexota bacterium]
MPPPGFFRDTGGMLADIDEIVEALRSGECIAIGHSDAGVRQRFLARIERSLSGLGREVITIDLNGITSGHQIAGRFVEAVLPFLDPEELGDILEALPGRGRLDVEVLAALLLLPERVAESRGRRVIAVLDGFEAIEMSTGFAGLGAVRDALEARSRTTYLFAGNRRVPTLFARRGSPLHGIARSIDRDSPAESRRAPATGPPPPTRVPVTGDPLASALIAWASPPPVKSREKAESPRDAWRRLLEEEEAARRWLDANFDEPDDDDRGDRRRRRRR